MPEQRAVKVTPQGATLLNREQRRALEKAGVVPDEFINVAEWIKHEHKDKLVTRKEFLAILAHVHKQNRWYNRLRVWFLSRRSVQWFLKTALGMRIETPATALATAKRKAKGEIE